MRGLKYENDPIDYNKHSSRIFRIAACLKGSIQMTEVLQYKLDNGSIYTARE